MASFFAEKTDQFGVPGVTHSPLPIWGPWSTTLSTPEFFYTWKGLTRPSASPVRAESNKILRQVALPSWPWPLGRIMCGGLNLLETSSTTKDSIFLFGIGSCLILLMHQWYDLSVYADARRRSQEEPGRATRIQQQPEEPGGARRVGPA